MKHLHLFFLFGALLCASCIQEEWGVIPNHQGSAEEIKEWDKNKTIDVYVVSNLSNNTETQIDAIASFFNNKGKDCSIGVVERSDIQNYPSYSACKNFSTDLAVKTARFASFSLQRYAANNIEGSTILFNHKLNTEESFKVTDDCYIKFVPIMAQSNVQSPVKILVPFATTRFSSEEQITASLPILTRLEGNGYGAVLVGTVKNQLTENLRSTVKELKNVKITFAVKEADKDYALFVIAPTSWMLRKTDETKLSGTSTYCLSIEASVK